MPQAAGRGLRRQQTGALNGYAFGMVLGVGVIAAIGAVLLW